MTLETYIGLIRGINVGGNKRVKMADLRAFLADIGLPDAQTLLQSGNFVFSSSMAAAKLEERIEREAEKRLGLRTTFFVRTSDQWKTFVEQNPFPAGAAKDPGHLLLYVSRAPPELDELQAIHAKFPGTEQIALPNGNLYVFAPDGIGTSKLLGSTAWVRATSLTTARNWNTVLSLHKLACK